VFVTPSWSSVDHEAEERADLFAISDRPLLRMLHVYRQEVLPDPQEITAKFTGS
jgi:gentisate 1,2-dioxygenase